MLQKLVKQNGPGRYYKKTTFKLQYDNIPIYDGTYGTYNYKYVHKQKQQLYFLYNQFHHIILIF